MAISASQVMELRSVTGAAMMDCKKALEEVGGDMEAAKDFLRKKGISIAQKKSSRETNEGGIGIVADASQKTAAMVQLACETDFVARNDQFDVLLARLVGQVLSAGAEDVGAQDLIEGQGTVNGLITEAVGKLGENLRLLEAVRLSVETEGVVGGYVHSNKKIGVLVALGSGKAVAADALHVITKDLAMHIAASQVSAVSADDIDPAVIKKEKEILLAQAQESGKPDDIAEKMVQGRLGKFIKEVTLMEQPFVKDSDRTIRQILADAGQGLETELQVERFVKFQF